MFNLKQIYKKRDPFVHKGNFGRLLIIGGSWMFTGSPIFNAMSALRAGCDLVFVFAPERAANIAATKKPDIITIPYDGNFLTRKQILNLNQVIKTQRISAVVIGGGLGRERETFLAIRTIIAALTLPMCIDADAIRALPKNLQTLENKKAVLTPHADEFQQLTGEAIKPDVTFRKEKVRKWARTLGVPILVKGAIDVVSNGEEIYLNRTGSVYMTKGGFGDTLAGICGALLARNVSPFDALCAATYINGRAGELAVKQYGEGVIASDIFKMIPKVIS